jgi:hypothetical protein
MINFANISTKIKEAGKWVLVFTILKILISVIEQFILYVYYSHYQLYFFDILGIFNPLLFQCLLFLVITLLTVKWIDRKRYYFVFPTILFLFLSFVFLFNLHIEENKLIFTSCWYCFAYNCFHYNANIICDVLEYIKSYEGIDEGGLYIDNPIYLSYFYILYVITPCIYYLGLTCLCNYIIKRKLRTKKYTN